MEEFVNNLHIVTLNGGWDGFRKLVVLVVSVQRDSKRWTQFRKSVFQN